MGEVYLAEDTKLRRTVALKFLSRQALGSDDDKARFVHEAQAAAALNHPNICTVHAIDESDGHTFIVMEHLEGQSLRDMIEAGPVEPGQVRELAAQIAGGMNEAHKRGIEHRDIKPENVIITPEGRAKIMDFGLAKSPARSQITRDGATLGTVSYMSPEQAMGRDVDLRTDIWSLGVMLYEMISGCRPFKGEYDQVVLYSIMNNDPEPLGGLRAGVPPELEQVVVKCLEKDMSKRYQSAEELLLDLKGPGSDASGQPQRAGQPAPRPARRSLFITSAVLVSFLAIYIIPKYFTDSGWWGSVNRTDDLKMLAVLPFENHGPETDQYFAGGITDAITARLASLSGLGVISRQSAKQYRGSSLSAREIGEELGADYILVGTIQRERPLDPASRVRITPQLIECSGDINVWADSYDEEMTEVFRLQSAIAERVATELDVKLLGPERRALAARPTRNLEAYDYYMHGIEFSDKSVDMDGSLEAIGVFEKAVELDPEFAVAWARLSKAYSYRYMIFGDSGALAEARRAVDEAMRIDPGLTEGQLAKGFLHYRGSMDFERALEYFLEVQRRQPGNADANIAIGYIKRRQGHWDEAIRNFKMALRADPRSYLIHVDHLGNTLITMRRYDEAEKYIDRAISLSPGSPGAYFAKAQIAILRDGDPAAARRYMLTMDDNNSPGGGCPAWIYAEPSIFRIADESATSEGDRIGKLDCVPATTFDTAMVTLIEAGSAADRNDIARAIALLDSSRVILERSVRGDGRSLEANYSTLAFVYVYLGARDAAIRAGEHSVQLLPVSKDAYLGPSYLHRLAELYTMTGEHEDAIDRLEILLSIPSRVSVNLLRLDSIWDPLRGDERFEALVEEYSGGAGGSGGSSGS